MASPTPIRQRRRVWRWCLHLPQRRWRFLALIQKFEAGFTADGELIALRYDAIEDVRKALEGLLAPEKNEEVTATIEVREVFKVPKIGTVAGCSVQDGKIVRGNRVRLVRDGIVIFEGGIASLRRFKEDVREVESGFECGIGLEGYNDVKVGDTIEAFKIVETMRKLV